MLQLERDKSRLEASGAALADSKHASEFALKVFAAAGSSQTALAASSG
jgi:hypothetical protein